MNTISMILPVIALAASLVYANHSVKKGASRRRAVITQVAVFAFVCALALAMPSFAFAASTSGATAAATTAAAADPSKGMSMLAVAIASGIASIGGGIAVAAAAPAAIGATGEDPKVFGKALIFVALGEGIAIYGLLIAILMLQKIA